MFESLRVFIYLLIEILKEVTTFLIVLIVMLATFTITYYSKARMVKELQQENVPSEEPETMEEAESNFN